MKKKVNSRNNRRTRASHPTFFPISEEMKQWSAMLISELQTWPGITSKSMFGFLFFYRRGVVFAALPRTRGFDSPSALIFKFNILPGTLQKRPQNDTRMDASGKEKGWFTFRLDAQADVREAWWWLNHSYEAAKQPAAATRKGTGR